jgi:hypothetical protein
MMEMVAILPPVARFFAAFLLILLMYSGALLFTYWISKDE